MTDVTTAFEQNRAHLRQVAYRMLGSASDADDAVQEAWLRLSRSDTADVANLTGWLTTVVARVCLDMLRRRREVPLERAPETAEDPRDDAQLAESVGLALVPVLLDGVPEAIAAPGGHLASAMRFTFTGDAITAIDIVHDVGAIEVAAL